MKRLVAVAIAQQADIVTFFGLVAIAPISLEGNPLVRVAWTVGPVVVLAAKLVELVVILWAVDRVTPRARAGWHRPARWIEVAAPSIGTGSGLAGAAANVAVLAVVVGVVR